MQLLKNQLFIKQEVEPLEILSELETKNKYSILDENNQKILFAYEESNFFSKQFLGMFRPLKIHIIDTKKQEYFLIKRPFYITFCRALVYLQNGSLFGTIKQIKTLTRREFHYFNPDNRIVFICVANIPHIWTYDILINNIKVAQIKKKWSGVLKETLTDADNYVIDFGNISNQSIRYAILIMALIIDLRFFEAGNQYRRRR